MGRNKFSQDEYRQIAKLLQKKNAANRAGQKNIRHILRVEYGFNISDFNLQGKAFGAEELDAALKRGAIEILDDATIAAMKARYEEQKERDRLSREREAVENGDATDWHEAMKEWERTTGDKLE
jgi:hypothetical protein